MYQTMSSLEEEVFAVYERACREQDLEVAEHLLQTLEAMAKRSGSKEQLEKAYLRLKPPRQ